MSSTGKKMELNIIMNNANKNILFKTKQNKKICIRKAAHIYRGKEPLCAGSLPR